MAVSKIKADSIETIELTVSGLVHLASAEATLYRRGNVGVIYIYMKNTAYDVATGNDVFFNISGLPRPIVNDTAYGVGFSGATTMVCVVGATGVTGRVTGSAWYRSYDIVCKATVLFA